MTALILTPQQISVSLEDKDGELRLDSRTIANGFGIKSHSDYQYQVLQKYETELGELGSVFKTEGSNGEIVWYLNQAQVNFAGTLARNTEKAVKFKLNLVKAFEMAKQIIPAQSDRIRELELELKLLDRRETIYRLQPKAIADRIAGVTEIQGEVKTRTVVVDQIGNVVNAGDTLTKTQIAHELGFINTKGKAETKQVAALVDEAIKAGAIPMPWREERTVFATGFDAELLPKLKAFYQASPIQRQKWIGE